MQCAQAVLRWLCWWWSMYMRAEVSLVVLLRCSQLTGQAAAGFPAVRQPPACRAGTRVQTL